MKYLDLLHSELRKPSFVMNDIYKKVMIVKDHVKSKKLITNKVMTILINLAVQDKAVQLIMSLGIIEDILYKDKYPSDICMLWLIANIALTGEQYVDQLFSLGIIDYIADMDIYDQYNEYVVWALSTLVHVESSTYHNTQLLYILLKMDDDFIHVYMPIIHKILRINNLIIPTFILEDGLTVLYGCFDDYSKSSVLLHLLFKYNIDKRDCILHLYDIFHVVLMNKLTLDPDYETCKIYKLIFEHFDVSDDIHIDFLIDNLYMNNMLLFYSTLELIGCKEIKLDQHHVKRVIKSVLTENDDINVFTKDCYQDFFMKPEVLSNLLDNDSDKLRKFINDLECKDILLNILDDTLFKKCLTTCLKYDYELPHFLKHYKVLI